MYKDLARTNKVIFYEHFLTHTVLVLKFELCSCIYLLILVVFNLWLYSVDPPYAPLEDRMVSNVTLKEPMTAQQDYRFTAVVTWYRPVYPYKTPNMYFVRWIKEGDIFPKGLVSVSEIIFCLQLFLLMS